MLKFKRILLKLSGESLMGGQGYGIASEMLQHYAREIKSVVELGAEVAIVIGGGNIFRGIQAEGNGIEAVTGDYMGMLATVINGLALQSAIEHVEVDTRLVSAIRMDRVAEPYIRRRSLRHLDKGRVVIFVAGTGNPFFTTDSGAALRANEMGANVILKGTRVDGIYSADPLKNPNATKYDSLSFSQCIEQNLQIMDMTAFTLCQENSMPIVVFDIGKAGNLKRIVEGDLSIGTIVS